MIQPPLDPALELADHWQRGFPLVGRPFAEIARLSDGNEDDVLAGLQRLQQLGIISRIGAVVRPNTAGASTLAALSCPPDDLEDIAARVSQERFVNHNYEREHRINLWFVVAAPDEGELSRTLQSIARRTACEVLDLRLERPYHIDLGFSLSGTPVARSPERPAKRKATCRELDLLAAIEDGLPLETQPYAAVARTLGWRESAVRESLARLIEAGIIVRFGCVLRHRALGYTANAMAVWDVPCEWVDAAGCRLAAEPGVTLCYRRNRAGNLWPYNLFAMIHGRDATEVRRQVARLTNAAGLETRPHDILFSRRCFTQRGARFSQQAMVAA
jgi:DNA-binding Lrp family transcriptional regulator